MLALLWLFGEHNGSNRRCLTSNQFQQNQHKIDGDANDQDNPDAGGMIWESAYPST
jgi:hypothetical protein